MYQDIGIEAGKRYRTLFEVTGWSEDWDAWDGDLSVHFGTWPDHQTIASLALSGNGVDSYIYDVTATKSGRLAFWATAGYESGDGTQIDIDDVSVKEITAEFEYDYLGRRISRTVGNTTTKYCYDGDQVIAEYENGTLVRKFIYGPGIDEPILMIDVTDSNKKYYYHFDGLGSVVALSDVNGVIEERYSYDVFGAAAIRDANDEPRATSDVGNAYMFTARRLDSETGLYYYRARYYRPEIGRFISADPIGYEDGMNLYTYVVNNPIIFTDAYGLECQDKERCREVFGTWYCPRQPSRSECQDCCDYMRRRAKPPWWQCKKRWKWWMTKGRRTTSCYGSCLSKQPIW